MFRGPASIRRHLHVRRLYRDFFVCSHHSTPKDVARSFNLPGDSLATLQRSRPLHPATVDVGMGRDSDRSREGSAVFVIANASLKIGCRTRAPTKTRRIRRRQQTIGNPGFAPSNPLYGRSAGRSVRNLERSFLQKKIMGREQPNHKGSSFFSRPVTPPGSGIPLSFAFHFFSISFPFSFSPSLSFPFLFLFFSNRWRISARGVERGTTYISGFEKEREKNEQTISLRGRPNGLCRPHNLRLYKSR